MGEVSGWTAKGLDRGRRERTRNTRKGAVHELGDEYTDGETAGENRAQSIAPQQGETQAIDVVVATCERLELLERTLDSIWCNTDTPFRLTVIDDASEVEGNRLYLRRKKADGLIDQLVLRKVRKGIAANLRALYGLTRSELVVYCDDDQLCPRVEPDWLGRLVQEMSARPGQGILSLNNPHGNYGGDKRRRLGVDGAVTRCRKSGGSFMMIRRDVLAKIAPPDGQQSPVSWMCLRARELGWENGYLTETFCWHIGGISMRNGWDLRRAIAMLTPEDMLTLEPAEMFRG